VSETLQLYLFRFDRKHTLWNRFDGDSLAGINPEELAVLPTAISDPMTVAEWWNIRQKCEVLQQALLAERALHLATKAERDEARSAFREYRARLLLDSGYRPGVYTRNMDEEFDGRYAWLLAVDVTEPTPDEIAYAKGLEEAGR
jgi:hypothetical protein